MTTYRQKFKGVGHWGDTYLMNQLETNLKTWFDWGFLQMGAWTNVTIPLEGAYGGDYSVLREVNDPSFTTRTVFESVRKDWCWESDVDYIDTTLTTQNPVSPALIYLNGVLNSANYINYPMGRVVFDSAVNANVTVTANYSYRNVQVYIADSVPWWNELQYNSFRVDDSHFSQLEDGSWGVGSQHRIQMPCIIIEAVPRCTSTPFQLGDGSYYVRQDVLAHCIAENRAERNKLVDVIRSQFDSHIWLFDNDAVVAATDFPLDYRGEIVDSSQNYLALVDETTGHRWESCRIINTQVSEVEAINSNLYEGVVRLTCEFILDD